METVLTPEDIARVCHEANRAYCMSTGDHGQTTWDTAPSWQKSSIVTRVEASLIDPDRTPEENHRAWMAIKEEGGWKYGNKKVPEQKEHPCMMPYDQLPKVQRLKSCLFLAVVHALQPLTLKAQRTAVVEDESPPMPEDSTLEVGVITADGEVVKNVEVETTIKPKRRKQKKKKGEDDPGD